MVNVASMLSRVARLVATPLVPADYLSLFHPLARAHRARVEAVRDEAPGVRTLVLRPGRGWRGHRAGQHVRLGVVVDGRIATRTFSISSAPGTVEVTVKAQGRVSTAIVRDLEVGTIIALDDPEGDFAIPHDARALAITAGSGITPVMSMLRAFAARGAMPDLVHVHYARTATDVIFGEELRGLAMQFPRYRPIIVHTATDPRRFSEARLDELVPDWRTREAWACGPHRLLEACTFPVTVEHFGVVLAPVAAATEGVAKLGERIVKSDGKTSLLVLAERAGLAPAHGCRMGICHSCDAILKSGRVRDLRSGVHIDEPGSRVQICVCAAAGDVELSFQGART